MPALPGFGAVSVERQAQPVAEPGLPFLRPAVQMWRERSGGEARRGWCAGCGREGGGCGNSLLASCGPAPSLEARAQAVGQGAVPHLTGLPGVCRCGVPFEGIVAKVLATPVF